MWSKAEIELFKKDFQIAVRKFVITKVHELRIALMLSPASL